MYVKPISALLLGGRSTPATRAIVFLVYPCLCLCLGFTQITRTTPLRWMTLHLSHIFFTDARTFIAVTSIFRSLLVPVCNSTAIEIVRRKLYQNSVAWKNANKMLAHFPRDVRKHLVLAVLQLDFEHSVWQSLQHLRHHFYSFFLRHYPLLLKFRCCRQTANNSTRLFPLPSHAPLLGKTLN